LSSERALKRSFRSIQIVHSASEKQAHGPTHDIHDTELLGVSIQHDLILLSPGLLELFGRDLQARVIGAYFHAPSGYVSRKPRK
jgi:hypothetical protein